MNKLRMFALAAAALVSTSAFAQAQTSSTTAAKSRAEGRGARGSFRGLNLSADEKAKVKAVRAKYKAENKSLHESVRPAMEQARALRQKGDTAGARAVLEKNKGSLGKVRSARQSERNAIRASLTPEHQKAFDAKLQQAAQMKKGSGKGHHGKKGLNTSRRPASNG